MNPLLNLNPNPSPNLPHSCPETTLLLSIEADGTICIPWISEPFEAWVKSLIPPEDPQEVLFGDLLCG